MRLTHFLLVIVISVLHAKEAEFKPGEKQNSLDTRGSRADVGTALKYYFYKKSFPSESILLKTGDSQGLNQSGYDHSKKTLVVIHGWTHSAASASVQDIVNASLVFLDVNTVAVDWSAYSSYLLYPFVVTEMSSVGTAVGNFVNFLIEQGTSVERVHFIGHSLGAHVAGFAGRRLISFGHKIDRITGLDPAAPSVSSEQKLAKEDAQFVDCIHTDGGSLGFVSPLGHVDYYPNGGVPIQPGCYQPFPNVCSHYRSYQFFAESIDSTHHFYARKCSGSVEAMPRGCSEEYTGEMGYFASRSDEGSFYLVTNASPPFAQNVTN